MFVRINKIVPASFVDGPGQRTVVFFQGCPLACPGCQNRHIWPADGGYQTPIHDLAVSLALLAARHGNITISGGEPMQQPGAVAGLVSCLRDRGISDAKGIRRHIVVYTGYTWEELFDVHHPARPWLREILENIDVLVDGRFIAAQDDPLISYRGSRNQRPIDVAATLAGATLAGGSVVTLDWDSPEVVISPDGSLYLPIGLAPVFAGAGPEQPTRRCGETR